MPIKFNSENKTFKLDTLASSYVIGINRYGYLMHHHYGAPVSDDALEYLNYGCRHSSHYPRVEMENAEIPFFSKSLHRMEYSCNGCGDFRASALSILRENGTADTDSYGSGCSGRSGSTCCTSGTHRADDRGLITSCD